MSRFSLETQKLYVEKKTMKDWESCRKIMDPYYKQGMDPFELQD